MVGKVDDRVFVGSRLIIDSQFVFIIQLVINGDTQVAGIVLFTIFA